MNITLKPFSSIKYEFIKYIDEGHDGRSVYLSKHKIKDTYFAIKKISEIGNHPEELLFEAEVGKKFDHPNFVKTFKNYINSEEKTHYLVMEYVEKAIKIGKFVQDYKESHKKLSFSSFKNMSNQLIEAITYSLLNGICPVDLNDRNILISEEKIKIIDFGLYKQAVYWDVRTLSNELKGHLVNLLSITDTENRKSYQAWVDKLSSLWKSNTLEEFIEGCKELQKHIFFNELPRVRKRVRLTLN